MIKPETMCQSIMEPKIKTAGFKNRTLIIEFVGPPGAGKTTCCECFSEALKEKNFKVLMTKEIKDYIHDMNFFSKFYFFSKVLLSRFHILSFYIFILAYNRIYSANSIYRYVRLSVFNLVLNKFIKSRDVDIVLLDQWVIQELWSATIFKLKTYHKVGRYLKMFYFKVDFVMYFDIDIATASERIELRKTKFSRFDRMDPDKRLIELKKYNAYLFQLFKNSDCCQKFVLSANQSPLENAEIFIQYLKKYINIDGKEERTI
jgi:thymidylate kinase